MLNKDTIPRIIPFAIYILFLVFGESIVQLFNNFSIHIEWLYVFKIVSVVIALRYFWHCYGELRIKPPRQDFVYATVAGLIVFVIWIFPYPSWLASGKEVASINPMLDQMTISNIIWMSVRILGATLVVSVMEELFWRSFIMRWFDNTNFLALDPGKITAFAYIGSACLFALEHHLWLAGLFAGLVYGELYKTYKNIWIPIFAHAVTNLLLGVWILLTGNWQYW
jgi:uncharacterized protein